MKTKNNRLLVKLILILMFFAVSSPIIAQDYYLMIGGGYNLKSSGAQIEENVRYVHSTLLSNPDNEVVLFFGDGRDPGPDKLTYSQAKAITPLARVFGQINTAKAIYSSNQLNSDSTSRASLLPGIDAVMSRLASTDHLFLIYNGHGGDNDFKQLNHLKLWGNEKLSVKELHSMLEKVDVSVPIQYVFTQCYSGAFHRLMYADTRSQATLHASSRCGFSAESDRRQSEGCSASLALSDYRDYTTYFFAALSGRTRTGGALKNNPDYDSNGAVSLAEAHQYTVENALSTDISISSSEYFLEQWTPWYVRWLPSLGELPKNHYSHIATRIANNNNLPWDARALTQLSQESGQRFANIEDHLMAVNHKIMQVQYNLVHKLIDRWPGIEASHTDHYQALLTRPGLPAINEWLTTDTDYIALLALQRRQEDITFETLHAKRRMTQVQKVRRYRNLARKFQYFEKYANAQARSNFVNLQQCEAYEIKVEPM